MAGVVRTVLASLALMALTACDGGPPKTDGGGDWRSQVTELRMSMSTDLDTDSGQAGRFDRFESYMTQATQLPVRLYRVNDYNSVIQAIASGQLDVATMGGSAYANVDQQIGELAAPILTMRGGNGEMGYYSALIVRADSPFQSLADLRGRSLGFVDRNSTSGYLMPLRAMQREGVDVDTYFSNTGITDGHPQAVMAVLNKQFDAAFVYIGGGTPETGFLASVYGRMADRGLIPRGQLRDIWHVGPMPNSPFVMRTDRPQAYIDLVRGALAAMPFDEPEIWQSIGLIPGTTLPAVNREFYEEVIALRQEEIAAERANVAQKGSQP
jgi:phosphonate transport system substrate-binding protein